MALVLDHPGALDDEPPPSAGTPAPRGGPVGRRRPGDRTVTVLFAATSFLASGLLFAVQPMVARLLLPRLGGSAAVWNTAMVFFQATLLAGYLIAHVGLRHLPAGVHRVAQVALLGGGLVLLPLAVPGGWEPPAGDPVGWTFLVLAAVVGLPFLALSTMSPTLQRWLAATDHPSGADPYVLYATGNAGSFLALLAYPLLVEPAAGVGSQVRGWAAAYGVLVALAAACALAAHLRRRPDGAGDPGGSGTGTGTAAGRLPARTLARWAALAAVPSALLLGVTRHLATDVASLPLLWVVPLALYLLTFVLAFSPRRPRLGTRAAGVAAFLVVPALLGWAGPVLGASMGHVVVALLSLAAFAAVSLAAHRRLWDERPPVERLTSFYLWVSAGGVLGGAAAALAAPLLFDTVLEYPLALAAGIAVLPAVTVEPERRAVLARVGVGVAGAALLLLLDGPGKVLGLAGIAVWAGSVFRRSPRSGALVVVGAVVLVTTLGTPGLLRRERTFYGVSQVAVEGDAHVLQSGTTVHGVQRTDPALAGEPLAYYTRSGPIGQVFDVLRARAGGGPLDTGVVGLGAGSIAAYSEAGDTTTFYEIDPGVVAIAEDPALFTYLSGAEGDVEVQVGDGRRLLEAAGGTAHDLLVLDAFSSDAIPLHLLTAEAFGVYRSRLAEGGVLAVHVSSRYFELAPEVAALALDAGFGVVDLQHLTVTDPLGQSSHWVVATDDPDVLDELHARGWTDTAPASRPWTDDRADLLSTLHLS